MSLLGQRLLRERRQSKVMSHLCRLSETIVEYGQNVLDWTGFSVNY